MHVITYGIYDTKDCSDGKTDTDLNIKKLMRRSRFYDRYFSTITINLESKKFGLK